MANPPRKSGGFFIAPVLRGEGRKENMRTEQPDSPLQNNLESLLRELAGYYQLLGLSPQKAEASARADFAEELGESPGLARAA